MIPLFLILSLLLSSCMKLDDSIQTNFVPTAPSGGSSSICPTNYVLVPALAPYTPQDFCVSRYEMKILGQANGDQVYNAAFVADSRADGTPWVSLTRDNAAAECSALGTGYELMTNGDWQTLARNIEGVGWNWSGSTIGAAGGLSRSVGMASGVAADEDSNSCVSTGNTCDLSTWNERRRVHQLSNGEYIWDVAGNVAEWVRDDTNYSDGDHEISQQANNAMNRFFGPAGNYTALNADPYGGLGSGFNSIANGTLARGGAWGAGVTGTHNGGIFAFTSIHNNVAADNSIGFRCAYRPLTSTTTPQSLMPTYVLPLTQVTADGSAVELGMQFTSSANGTVTKIRFFRGNANPAGYTVSLWTSGGVLLGTGSGTDGTIPGWQEISLNTPVPITAGSDYVASYFTSNGLYASHPQGFNTAYQGLGTLSAPINAGVFNVGAGFPAGTWNSNNYYVDVVFEP